MQAKYSALLYTHDPQMGHKVKTFFSEEDHVLYLIKGKEVLNIMQV